VLTKFPLNSGLGFCYRLSLDPGSTSSCSSRDNLPRGTKARDYSDSIRLHTVRTQAPEVRRAFLTVREERAFFSEDMERLSSGYYLQNDGHVLSAKAKPSKG
jgi:hypothetical protein